MMPPIVCVFFMAVCAMGLWASLKVGASGGVLINVVGLTLWAIALFQAVSA